MNKVTIFLTSVFLSLFFSGVQVIGEPIKLTPYDVVFVIFGTGMLINLLYRGRLYINLTLRQAMAIFMLLLIWHSVQMLRASNIMRAFTLLLILIRDGLTMLLISTAISSLPKRDTIASLFFNISILTVIPGLLLFLVSISTPDRIINEPYPGLIYRAGERLIPHFQGFSHNPIYFATLSLFSITTGFFILTQNRQRKMLSMLGLLILAMAFFAAFQRGPFVVLMMFLTIVIVNAIFLPSLRRTLKKTVRVPRVYGLVLFVLLLLAFVRLPYYEITLLQRLMWRFQTAEWHLRFNRWSQMLSISSESPVIGYGLRESEMLIGGQFVENSYIEIFYDQGLIGLITWVIFLGYISVVGIKKLRTDISLLPWFSGWWIVLLSMGYISMHYDPLTWILAGVIVGWRTNTSQIVKENPIN